VEVPVVADVGVDPAAIKVGGPAGREPWPPINDGGPCAASVAFGEWFASSSAGFVAAAMLVCGVAAFVCVDVGSFELAATTRGRVTAEAACVGDAPADEPGVDLFSREVFPVDDAVRPTELPAEFAGEAAPVFGAVCRESPFTASELS